MKIIKVSDEQYATLLGLLWATLDILRENGSEERAGEVQELCDAVRNEMIKEKPAETDGQEK